MFRQRYLDAKQLLESAAIVFWDFDGVIKESLDAKADAFESLFKPFGSHVAERVRAHHQQNNGVSRFEKMPLYLQWAGESQSQERVDEYCHRFSSLVTEAVIDSKWVPGVEHYIREHSSQQLFVVVSATPQPELEHILDRIGLTPSFTAIYGAPMTKRDAIADTLRRNGILGPSCVMVGDSPSDHEAAMASGVRFLLRRTKHNVALQARHDGPSFEDL